MQFWLPTRPYNIIAAINRVAAATGSPRYAQAAHGADYNGHHVTVYFNDYRKYWLAEYTWAGRQVLARGGLESCLKAAKAEYDRGALGASVAVTVDNEADAALCQAMGFLPWSKEIEAAHDATWRTELHGEVNMALRYEQQVGIPATGFLANSKTMAEYKAKIDAFSAERRRVRS